MTMFGTMAHSAEIVLNNNDAFGQSSFAPNAGTTLAQVKWSDGQFPTAGNNYDVNGRQLRTPADANSYSFAGDSLTVEANGIINTKGTSNSVVYTFANLILSGGRIANGNGVFNGGTQTIAGAITLADGTTSSLSTPAGGSNSNVLSVTAAISGTGALYAYGEGGSIGKIVRLSNTNNAYSGGTTVGGGTSTGGDIDLQVTADRALGSGNLTIAPSSATTSSNVTFSGGLTNDYIADVATLNFATGPEASPNKLNLNFTGSDILMAILVDNVALGAGIYGSSTNTDVGVTQVNWISGTGTLTVAAVPEPSMVMAGAVATGIMMMRRRRQH
ncbi:MAG TPA: hypothetical protein VGN72_03260 [Tepidisphaeraceae bacterium]|nr:hypothetical protein [Tepidisphaeraceae bacterium]